VRERQPGDAHLHPVRANGVLDPRSLNLYAHMCNNSVLTRMGNFHAEL
jgi:hypothetical protein